MQAQYYWPRERAKLSFRQSIREEQIIKKGSISNRRSIRKVNRNNRCKTDQWCACRSYTSVFTTWAMSIASFWITSNGQTIERMSHVDIDVGSVEVSYDHHKGYLRTAVEGPGLLSYHICLVRQKFPTNLTLFLFSVLANSVNTIRLNWSSGLHVY